MLAIISAESFVFHFAIQNINIEIHRTITVLLFCMGVKLASQFEGGI